MSENDGTKPEPQAGLLILRDEEFSVRLRGIGDVRLTEFEQLLRSGLEELYNVRGYRS